MASSICRGARRVLIVWTLAAAALASADAALAEAPPASEAARSAARAKLVEGVDALGRGEHRLALDKFEQAYALVPSPKIHYDFGLAYLGLGRRAEALSAFERFLAEAQDAPADKRAKAAERVTALRQQVGAATVTVERARDGVTIAASTPLVPPAASDPLAQPAASDPLAPRSGERVKERGSTSDERAPTDPRQIAALSIGAAGVALLGAGLTFGVLAKRESDSLSRDSANGAIKPVLYDPGKDSRGTTYETLQVVSLVAGAVGLATGIVLYTTTRGRASVAPVASRGLTGATVQVHF